MAFYVRKIVDGVEMWLKRATPFVVWGPLEQARNFATRREALAACRLAGATSSDVTVVGETQLSRA